MSEERGTGRTTRQLQSAPLGAIYVWCNERLDYPRVLAKAHWVNRPDLWIVGPSHLTERAISRENTLVIDHATELTEKQKQALRKFERVIFYADQP